MPRPILLAGLAALAVLGSAGQVPAAGSESGTAAASVTRSSGGSWTSQQGVSANAGEVVRVSGGIRSASKRPSRARIVLTEAATGNRTVRTVTARPELREFQVTHRVVSGSTVSARILTRKGRPVRISHGRLGVVPPAATSPTSVDQAPQAAKAPDPTKADTVAPDTSAPDAVAPDTSAPDSVAQDPAADSGTAQPPVDSPAGWRLRWSDEFSGRALDTDRWRAYHNTYGDGNNELACLTPDNVVVAGGQAAFVAERERITCPGAAPDDYSSGFIGSREAGRYYPLYGRYEIRARIPHGQGLWPAFWLRHRQGADVAEVDIMEYFFSQVPGKTTQTLHFPTTVGRNVAKRSVFTETPVRGTGGWHTWAVEIEPVTGSDGSTDVRFRFLIDETVTLQYVNQRPEAWTGGDPDRAWDIAVNLAVGGDWAGHPDRQLGYLAAPGVCSLTYRAPTNGDPATCPTAGIWSAELPGQYVVDYVRVYTR